MNEAVDSSVTDRAITSRRSVRAFLDTPVPRDTVEDILHVASQAPSGTNMQPWKVYVATGETLKRLTGDVLAAHGNGSFERRQTWKYYPDTFPEPYKTRRRAVGLGLYGLLGIEKGDGARMHQQMGRNYMFFDAPVGLMFTIDDRLEIGSWLDYGMFLQNIMIAARARGLDTCPQAAWPAYDKAIRPVLGIGDGETIVCGMALGYKDPEAIENTLVPEREPVESFTTFLD